MAVHSSLSLATITTSRLQWGDTKLREKEAQGRDLYLLPSWEVATWSTEKWTEMVQDCAQLWASGLWPLGHTTSQLVSQQ